MLQILGGGNNPQINNTAQVNVYVDENQFHVNDSDLNNYSILQYFTNEIPNIGNDYIARMNELKDNIIKLNNSIETPQHKEILNFLFISILSDIVHLAQKQYRYTETDKKLNCFHVYYLKLLTRNDSVNEEQLNKMCTEFQHILNGKPDVGFEIKYNKYKRQIENEHNRLQPMIKRKQKTTIEQ